MLKLAGELLLLPSDAQRHTPTAFSDRHRSRISRSAGHSPATINPPCNVQDSDQEEEEEESDEDEEVTDNVQVSPIRRRRRHPERVRPAHLKVVCYLLHDRFSGHFFTVRGGNAKSNLAREMIYFNWTRAKLGFSVSQVGILFNELWRNAR